MSRRGLDVGSCVHVMDPSHAVSSGSLFVRTAREIDTGDQLIDTASQSSEPCCFALELEYVVLLTSPPWILAASLRRIFLTGCEEGGCGLAFQNEKNFRASNDETSISCRAQRRGAIVGAALASHQRFALLDHRRFDHRHSDDDVGGR